MNLRAFVMTIVAFTFLVNVPCWADPSLEDLLPKMPEAEFGAVAGTRCSPNVSLESLRLGWGDADGLHYELPMDSERTESFVKAFPVYASDNPNAPCRGKLPAAEQRWVCDHIEGKAGETLYFYFPKTGQLAKGAVSEIGFQYNGLDGVEYLFADCGIATGNPKGCAVVFRCAKKPRIATAPVRKLKAEELEAIEKIFPKDANFSRVDKMIAGIQVPRSPYKLCTVRNELSDLLYCVENHKSSSRIVPLEDRPDGFIAVAERPGYCCYPINHATVYVLPDFDGDGEKELLVNATTTYLLQLSKGTLRYLKVSHNIAVDATQ